MESEIENLIANHEEWIEASNNPEEKQNKIDYLQQLMDALEINYDPKFFDIRRFDLPSFSSGKKLSATRRALKDSYGWIDELPTDEREKELSDSAMRAEYEFYKKIQNEKTVREPPLKNINKKNEYYIAKSSAQYYIVKNSTIKKPSPELEISHQLPHFNSLNVKKTGVIFDSKIEYLSAPFTNGCNLFIQNSTLLGSPPDMTNSSIANSLIKSKKRLVIEKSKIDLSQISVTDLFVNESQIKNLKLMTGSPQTLILRSSLINVNFAKTQTRLCFCESSIEDVSFPDLPFVSISFHKNFVQARSPADEVAQTILLDEFIKKFGK